MQDFPLLKSQWLNRRTENIIPLLTVLSLNLYPRSCQYPVGEGVGWFSSFSWIPKSHIPFFLLPSYLYNFSDWIRTHTPFSAVQISGWIAMSGVLTFDKTFHINLPVFLWIALQITFITANPVFPSNTSKSKPSITSTPLKLCINQWRQMHTWARVFTDFTTLVKSDSQFWSRQYTLYNLRFHSWLWSFLHF